MELENYFVRAIDQGPLFWVAAGSVIMGVTLITAAGIAQFRRLRGSTLTAPDIEPEVKPFVAGLTASGKPGNTFLEHPARGHLDRSAAPDWAPAALEDNDLQGLLTRIRHAADQLDTFCRQKSPGLNPRTTSLLKDAPPAVEYVS